MLRRAAAALGHLAPPVPDNCELIELTEASVLENVRRRYEKREIYTFTGRRLLIALNPYEALASYSEVDMERFPNKQSRAACRPAICLEGNLVSAARAAAATGARLVERRGRKNDGGGERGGGGVVLLQR